MLVAFLAMTAQLGGQISRRPPTLDPTYGFPVPPISALEERRPVPSVEWIWASTTSDNQVIYLRGAVKLAHPDPKTKLYISVDNYFEAYVNGRQVGARGHDAGVDNWNQAQKYDVGAWLHEGKNVIAIRAENAGGAAGALARLEAGGKPIIETSPAWKVSETQADGWQNEAFDDSSWSAAKGEGHLGVSPWGDGVHGWPGLVQYQPSYLKHLPIGPVASETTGGVTTIIGGHSKPGTLQVKGDSEVILDFGEELTGRVQIESSAPVTAVVETGESRDEATGKPYTTAELALESGKPQFSPYTAYRFAKIKLSGVPTGGAVVKVTCDHLYYPVEYKGSFDCSEPLLTQVWYTGAYTAHLCMQEDIWDAPKRDRLRWMGDLHVSGEVINNAFLDEFLMKQTMRRLREDAQGGHPQDALPVAHVNGIPGYSAAWISGLADFYRHVGDLLYIRSQAPFISSMLDFMRADLDDNGVFANKNHNWAYTDWAPEFNGDHPLSRIATQLFFAHAASEAAYLLGEVGDTAGKMKAAAFRTQLEEAAQKNMVDQAGIFGDRRQANAMAIYSGVATEAQKEKIQRDILAPNAPAWNFVATPYYNNYVLFAMKNSEEALQIIRRIWGQMVKEGATTFYEGYDPSWEKDHFHLHLQADDGTGTFVSLCHGWSAGATNYLTEKVLGVRSTGAGFKTFTIKPDLGGLRWVKGKVPTPSGAISVSLEQAGTGLKAKIVVPRGTVGTLSGFGSADGERLKPISLGEGNWRLGPGEYNLTLKS